MNKNGQMSGLTFNVPLGIKSFTALCIDPLQIKKIMKNKKRQDKKGEGEKRKRKRKRNHEERKKNERKKRKE